MHWTLIEWIGTIFALSGSAIMANKKINHIWAWLAWLVSSILFMTLFQKTNQWGMFFMNLFGFLITSLGLLQWSKKSPTNPLIMNGFYYISLIGIFLCFILITIFLIEPNIKTIEWFGSIMAISAQALLASKHKKFYYCWIFWLIGNASLAILTYYTRQWGVFTLQMSFTIINTYGFWFWIIKKNGHRYLDKDLTHIS